METSFERAKSILMGQQKAALEQMSISWDGVKEAFEEKYGADVFNLRAEGLDDHRKDIQQKCLALYNIIGGLVNSMMARPGKGLPTEEQLREIDFRSRRIIQKISEE